MTTFVQIKNKRFLQLIFMFSCFAIPNLHSCGQLISFI